MKHNSLLYDLGLWFHMSLAVYTHPLYSELYSQLTGKFVNGDLSVRWELNCDVY